MLELFRTDLKRVFKDKLLMVLGILAVVFALMMPLLYAAIATAEEFMELGLTNGLYAKNLFFQSFSMGNNLGLIAPVLLAIVLCKDFSYGTVRNKIIAGKRRGQIYLSLFAVCSIVLIGVMLLSAFVCLGVSLIFFDYQATAFTAADFWYFLESLAFSILVLLFMSAFLSSMCACMKNVGLAIVLYVAVAFLLVMVGSILQMIVMMPSTGTSSTMLKVLSVIDRLNVGSAALYIGAGTTYTWKDVLYLTLPSLAGILGFSGLGMLIFGKKDLK